jgi:hypothetical protein
MKSSRLGMSLLTLLMLLSTRSHAGTPVFTIEIKDHLFYPAEFSIPAHQKVKLLIHNKDSTAEEFESYELNREKVIPGNTKAVIFVGPLPPGEYGFFGEFNPKTAQGKIIVTQD